MVGGGLFAIFGASKPRPVALDPFGDLDDIDKIPADPRTASQLEALVEKTRDVVLANHFAGRPANTMKNYAPKQREWSAWCAKYAWREGGKYLPGDLVDEGKLLLFIRQEVATRPPRRGRRLVAEKKRRAEVKAKAQKKRRKKRGDEWIAGDEEVEDESYGEAEDDGSSDLFLMYNTVRGYVSAINELRRIQTSKGLQNSPMLTHKSQL